MENKSFYVPIPSIWFSIQSDNGIRMHIGGNSRPCYDVQQLVKAVGDAVGHGSYLVRTRNKEYKERYYTDGKGQNVKGRLGYENDVLKGRVVEAAYKAAVEAKWPVTIDTFFIEFDDIHEDEPALETKQ